MLSYLMYTEDISRILHKAFIQPSIIDGIVNCLTIESFTVDWGKDGGALQSSIEYSVCMYPCVRSEFLGGRGGGWGRG